MNILIVPNSFKNSLTSTKIADIIEEAFMSVNQRHKIKKIPLADGGDGTLEVLAIHNTGKYKNLIVSDPIGREVKASYYLTDKNVAIIELSNASGLKLLASNELNPEITNTFGTGELILDAINKGATKIVIGVGGSATIDLGIGALLALGVIFYDNRKNNLADINSILNECTEISIDHLSWIPNVEFTILCDVNNKLFGEDGGIQVYGRQKSGTKAFLDSREKQANEFLNRISKQMEIDLNTPFLGASGGFPVLFNSLFNANLISGSEYLINELKVEDAITKSDFVITGEGKFDKQTLSGKIPFEIAKVAKKHKKTVILIAGQTDILDNLWFDGIFPIMNKLDSLEDTLKNSENLLFNISRQIALLISKTS